MRVAWAMSEWEIRGELKRTKNNRKIKAKKYIKTSLESKFMMEKERIIIKRESKIHEKKLNNFLLDVLKLFCVFEIKKYT